MKPVVIDLFCGLVLRKSHLILRANAAIQKLVACRAQHPNHVRFGVFHFSIRAISPMFWTMGQLDHPAFSAGLASGRQIRVLATHSDNDAGVLVLPAPVVDLLGCRIFPVKGTALLFRCLTGAVVRAVAAIAVWLNYGEMLPTYAAVSSTTGDIGLLVPPQATGTSLAFGGTVALIWPLGRESGTAR